VVFSGGASPAVFWSPFVNVGEGREDQSALAERETGVRFATE
jgi:hypothetical protein